jgi:hypothetical protein
MPILDGLDVRWFVAAILVVPVRSDLIRQFWLLGTCGDLFRQPSMVSIHRDLTAESWVVEVGRELPSDHRMGGICLKLAELFPDTRELP